MSRSGMRRPLLADQARPWTGHQARSWTGHRARLRAGYQARLRAGGLLAGCAIVLVVLGVLFAGQATADPFDRAVDAPVINWLAGHQTLALWLAYPATLVPAGMASLIAAAICLARGWLRGAVLALLAVPVTSGLNDAIFKHLFHRTYLGALTYPSGHAAAASALAAALTLLLLSSGPPPGRLAALRWLIPALAWLAVVVVAVGVIGLRWHYFTDTIGGSALGTGTVCALALILDLSWPPPRRPDPGQPDPGQPHPGQPDPSQSRPSRSRTAPRPDSAPGEPHSSRSEPGR
jgi:membrane-associated phospholipid phosphatase